MACEHGVPERESRLWSSSKPVACPWCRITELEGSLDSHENYVIGARHALAKREGELQERDERIAEQDAILERLRPRGGHPIDCECIMCEWLAENIAQIDKLVRAIFGIEQIEDGEDFEECGHDVDEAIAKAVELWGMLLTSVDCEHIHVRADSFRQGVAINDKLDQQAATKATEAAEDTESEKVE